MNQAVTVKLKQLSEDKFHEVIHKAIDKLYIKDKLKRGEHSRPWADTTVSVADGTIKVKVYVNFKSPNLSQAERNKLVNLANAGIAKYWSRKLTVEKTVFQVSVTAQHKADSPFPALLRLNKDSKYARSFNAGVLGLDARFIYNQGSFQNLATSDSEFMLTCAHEFGHSVLKVAGGISLSWGHKGSTGVISQAIKKSTPGYPVSGPIDLMKYYDDKKQRATLSQLINDSIASEKDLMRLIWLSKITWK